MQLDKLSDAELQDIAGQIVNLKPAEAIAFLKSKGFEITWSWREQVALNNSQVFTVAKAMRMDILQDIKDALGEALKRGDTFAEFQAKLKPVLKAKGWWGAKEIDGVQVQLGSPQRLTTIFRTNLQSAMNVGRWEQFEANADDRPWLKYVAVLDQSTRDSHRALHGVTKRIDDPFWDTFMPPISWNCRCAVIALTDEEYREDKDKNKRVPRGVKPDEGFDNNPGKNRWQPDMSKYDEDIIDGSKS